MLKLPNGCRCSEPTVTPKTWKRNNASIKNPWYIVYRFHDPLFKEKYPNGYQKWVKGMNRFKTLKERQDATAELLANELHLLLECAYNPILDTCIQEEQRDYAIPPTTPLMTALEAAKERIAGVEGYKGTLRSNLKYCAMAAAQIGIDKMAVKDVERRHIKMLLDQCGKIKAVWTNATHNQYLGTITRLFNELLEVEAVKFNPADKISFLKNTKRIKMLLTDDERILIDSTLRKDHYTFWRFVNIFFHSGARTPEILKVRYEDVDLQRQMVKYTILKGKEIREVERAIKNNVVHLWAGIMAEAVPGNYLFSRGLKPGAACIRTDSIKKRWRKLVQDENALNIKATWYSLKHLNTDEMEEMYGAGLPALHNRHSEDMVKNHYAVGLKGRAQEAIKKAANSFVPIEK